MALRTGCKKGATRQGERVLSPVALTGARRDERRKYRKRETRALLSERVSRWTTSDSYILEVGTAYNTGIANLWTATGTEMPTEEGYIVCSRSENKLEQVKTIACELSKIAAERPLGASHMGYEDYKGGVELRRAVAEYANKHICEERVVNEENLLVSAGCGVVIENIFLALADQGDCALVPAPYYSSFDRDLGMRAGVSIECVHSTTRLSVIAFEDAYQLAIESGKRPKALLLTNPHNPLGIVYREGDLRELLIWAMGKRLHLISDEIYVNSIYESAGEKTFVSMMDLSLDLVTKGTTAPEEEEVGAYVRDFVHTVFGFSKDFCCSGLRIGCVHTENEALLTAWNALGYSCAISTHTQHIFSHLLTNESGKFVGDFITRNKTLLNQAASDLSNALKEAKIDFVKPTAGLFFMIDLRPMLPYLEEDADADAGDQITRFEAERELWRFLAYELKVVLTPGEFCHCKEPGFFRLCFAWMEDSASNVEAVRRIAKHYPSNTQ
jgi:1-aminocyclopropane-1-carboxylate synthase